MSNYKKISLTPLSGTNFADVTPSDSVNLSFIPRGVYIGATGNLKVSDTDGTIVTFTALAAGVIHPLSPVRIYSTGTTATGIIIVA